MDKGGWEGQGWRTIYSICGLLFSLCNRHVWTGAVAADRGEQVFTLSQGSYISCLINMHGQGRTGPTSIYSICDSYILCIIDMYEHGWRGWTGAEEYLLFLWALISIV